MADASPLSNASPSPTPVITVEEELQQLKEKFASWKAKAKEGVDVLRSQVRGLSEQLEQATAARAKAERDAILAMEARDKALSSLESLSRIQGGNAENSVQLLNDICSSAYDIKSSLISEAMASCYDMLHESFYSSVGLLKTLEKKHASAVGDFEKFKTRSAKTLQLTSGRADDLAAKLESANRALQEANANLSVKDRTLAAIDGRLQDVLAQLHHVTSERDALLEQHEQLCSERRAVRRDSNHMTGRDHSDMDLESALQDAVASAELRMREELEALASAHREEIDRRDLEIAQLRAKLAAVEAKALLRHNTSGSNGVTTDDDAYVQMLRTQLEQARDSAKDARLERDQLQAQVERLHGRLEALKVSSGRATVMSRDVGGPAADAAVTALANCSIDELRRQLVVKSEQLWDANQQVLHLRAALKTSASHHITGRETVETQQQQQYLRSVLLNFLTARSDDVKAGLIPVLATLLRLTSEELRATFAANPDWIT